MKLPNIAPSRLLLVVLASCCKAEDSTRSSGPIFAQQNLAAWCIVPFDSKKRGPEERAEMLQRLGIKVDRFGSGTGTLTGLESLG